MSRPRVAHFISRLIKCATAIALTETLNEGASSSRWENQENQYLGLDLLA